MPLITTGNLVLASDILRYRLIKPAHIGVTILSPAVKEATILENHFGRFIGYFKLRPNGEPCFVLAGRSDPLGEIDHLFLFYIGHNFKKIQPSEKVQFKKTLPLLFSEPQVIKSAVINIQSEAPKTCDLSILIQSVEYSIHPNLIDNFTPLQTILAYKGSSLVCFNPNIPVPNCDISFENTSLWFKLLRELDMLVIHDYSHEQRTSIPKTFDVLISKFENHIVYVIHYQSIKTLMLLLPHARQFTSLSESDEFLGNLLHRLRPYKPKYIGATRFYGDNSTTCDSEMLIKACILALTSGSNPLTIIKEPEVNTFLRDDNELQVSTKLSTSRASSQELEDADGLILENHPYDLDDDFDSVITDLRLDGPDGNAEVFSITSGNASQVVSNSDSSQTIIGSYDSQKTVIQSQDSQKTIVYSQASRSSLSSSASTIVMTEFDVFKYIQLFRLKGAIKQDLANLIPRSHVIPATDDLRCLILNDLNMYYRGINYLLGHWEAFTSVRASPITLSSNPIAFDRGVYRIAICTINDDNMDSLVLVNTENLEWIYINPDNQAYKDPNEFEKVKQCIIDHCPQLRKGKCKPVMLTSHFHQGYPKIHLLMSLYYLGRLLRYSLEFPTKLIYGEHAFRGYCYDICLQLQLANHQYNSVRSLIGANGALKSGAYRSISSPVEFVRSVVPTDQCPYCKKRGFNNLGRHMAMLHGGQSELGNEYRHGKR